MSSLEMGSPAFSTVLSVSRYMRSCWPEDKENSSVVKSTRKACRLSAAAVTNHVLAGREIGWGFLFESLFKKRKLNFLRVPAESSRVTSHAFLSLGDKTKLTGLMSAVRSNCNSCSEPSALI